jgi:DNA-binding transcriptional regulator WhiA
MREQKMGTIEKITIDHLSNNLVTMNEWCEEKKYYITEEFERIGKQEYEVLNLHKDVHFERGKVYHVFKDKDDTMIYDTTKVLNKINNRDILNITNYYEDRDDDGIFDTYIATIELADGYIKIMTKFN